MLMRLLQRIFDLGAGKPAYSETMEAATRRLFADCGSVCAVVDALLDAAQR